MVLLHRVDVWNMTDILFALSFTSRPYARIKYVTIINEYVLLSRAILRSVGFLGGIATGTPSTR